MNKDNSYEVPFSIDNLIFCGDTEHEKELSKDLFLENMEKCALEEENKELRAVLKDIENIVEENKLQKYKGMSANILDLIHEGVDK